MTEPAPNWYPDPSDSSRLRYWDGVTWTEHFAPRAATPGAAPPPRKGPTRIVNFRTGWTLIGLGLACGVAAGFLLVATVGPAVQDLFLSDPCATPCDRDFELREGHYLVFEQLGRSTSIGPYSSTTIDAPTITPADVTLTSSAGEPLVATDLNTTQTIDRNGTIYRGVAGFDVPSEGTYRLSIDVPDQSRVVLAPGLGQTFLRAIPGLLTAGLGSMALLAGFVVLLIAWVRRPDR